MAEPTVPAPPKSAQTEPVSEQKIAQPPRLDDPVAAIIKAFENPHDIERIAPQPDRLPPGEFDPRLITYIETAFHRGQKLEDIQRDLLKAGHNQAKVERHIAHATARVSQVWHQKWFHFMLIFFALIACASVVYVFSISLK